jgi:hypothetical protein
MGSQRAGWTDGLRAVGIRARWVRASAACAALVLAIGVVVAIGVAPLTAAKITYTPVNAMFACTGAEGTKEGVVAWKPTDSDCGHNIQGDSRGYKGRTLRDGTRIGAFVSSHESSHLAIWVSDRDVNKQRLYLSFKNVVTGCGGPGCLLNFDDIILSNTLWQGFQIAAVDNNGNDRPGGVKGILPGTSSLGRVIVNFDDPAGRTIWTLRFQAAYRSDSIRIACTKGTGITNTTPCTAWTVEAVGDTNGNGVESEANLVQSRFGNSRDQVNEGMYFMPFKVEFWH